MKVSSILLDFGSRDKIHLKRMGEASSKSPVICFHGAFSSGRVFYSKDGHKGFAPNLAKTGYEVFIPDNRGHGLSTPQVNEATEYGMHEYIIEDFPFIFENVKRITSKERFHVVAHSDGGLLLLSFLARFPDWCEKISSITLLGTKRSIQVRSIKKFFAIDLVWYLLCPLVVKSAGYLPAVKFKIGSDNDTKNFTLQRMEWLKGNSWVDPIDEFDYQAAWNNGVKPPILAYAAINDPYHGNREDVRKFLEELGYSGNNLKILGRSSGYGADYDHISMLTHRAAMKDHFPEIFEWIKNNSN